MLKFTAPKPDGGKIIGLGLTAENIKRLQADDPIMFSLSELGLKSSDDIFIMVGEDQQDIVNKLKGVGVWPKGLDIPFSGK